MCYYIHNGQQDLSNKKKTHKYAHNHFPKIAFTHCNATFKNLNVYGNCMCLHSLATVAFY